MSYLANSKKSTADFFQHLSYRWRRSMAEWFVMKFENNLCGQTAVIFLPGFWKAFWVAASINVDISDDESSMQWIFSLNLETKRRNYITSISVGLAQSRYLPSIILKFPYNAHSDWLKQRALLEKGERNDDGKLAFKFLLGILTNLTQIKHPPWHRQAQWKQAMSAVNMIHRDDC